MLENEVDLRGAQTLSAREHIQHERSAVILPGGIVALQVWYILREITETIIQDARRNIIARIFRFDQPIYHIRARLRIALIAVPPIPTAI